MNREGERVASADASMPKLCPSCRTRYPADALFCAFDGSPLTTSPAAMAAAAATDPYIGHEIVGPIEIKQLVGIGAMGRVYRGFQKGIDRDVAVKILHRELSANPTVVARFHREAKVASRLAHPNVVHVLLTGQLPDGAMYIVMEYLDGMSLQSALAASGGAMPLPRALHVAIQLCDAVGEAHAQGIVHRDLKPENVMLVTRADDPDFVKVLDFGIARLNWGEQSMATAAGLIFGTARYISPEAAQGEKVSPAADVYSIAMMFYQMLSGRTAFEAEQAVALLVQQIHDPPPPLKAIARASYVPDPIAAAVMANLAKRPEGRAENARELGRALLEAAVASGLHAHDILARPGMSGGRVTHASSVPPPPMSGVVPGMLGLGALVARGERSPVPRTMYDAPSGDVETVSAGRERAAPSRGDEPWIGAVGRRPARTEIAEPAPASAASPPSMATAKWSPPSALAESRPTSPSHVDATMDEHRQPASASSPSSRHTATAQPQGAVPAPTPSRAELAARAAVTAKPALSGARVPAPSSPPSVYIERDIARNDAAARGRIIAVVVACFFVGVVGMAVATKVGVFGPSRPAGPALDALLARANDALMHQRWDSPRGDNVRDVTDEGLARWPHEAQFMRIRSLACNDIVRAARATREEGNVTDALHLAKLAYQLDPTDEAAQKLAEDLEAQAQSPPSDSVPPLAATEISRAPVVALAASGAPKVSLDTSNAKPGVGQPVDFSARVAPATAGSRVRVEAASFRIAGPGIAPGTQLDALDDGSGTFRATFAFLQAGRFDVTFVGRADGAPVHALRVVQVAAQGASGPTPPPGEAKAPAPAAQTPASAAPPAPAAGGTEGPPLTGPGPAPAPQPSAKWL